MLERGRLKKERVKTKTEMFKQQKGLASEVARVNGTPAYINDCKSARKRGG